MAADPHAVAGFLAGASWGMRVPGFGPGDQGVSRGPGGVTFKRTKRVLVATGKDF